MPPSLALVLGSAVLHAGWNLCIKRHPDPNAGLTAVAGISATFGLVITLLEVASGLGPPFASARAVELAVACGVAEAAYFLALGRTLRDASLGVGYVVVRGGSVLMVWPLAFLAHGEVPTALQACGIAFMIGGLALLVPRGASPAGSRAGYLWALTAALFVATYHVLYKLAMAAGGRPWAVFGVAMLLATPATVMLMGRSADLSGGQLDRVRASWRSAPLLLLTAGIMSGLGFGLALHAMRTAGAAWVGTLRNSSVALAPLLGWWFLGERPDRRTASGFLLVTAAVVLLAL